MAENWLARLQRWWRGEQASPPPSSDPPRSSLKVALGPYQRALEGLTDDPQTLLPVLLARDQVEAALGQTKQVSVEEAQRLVGLDGELCQKASRASVKELSKWRQSLHPPEARWWWSLDREIEERDKKSDLPWAVLGGTMIVATIPLTLEILKRLLVGAPDTLSIVGTLVTLILTASPLSKRGRELAGWIWGRIPRLQPRFQAEAMAGMALLALVLVGVGWWRLPRLAVYYNNKGHDALQDGHLNAARRSFERAVALNPNESVGYYHLAIVYEEIGQPDEAIKWYQRAIEYDLDLGAAYNNLGRLFILKGDLKLAVATLQAGLRHSSDEAGLERVTRYKLLSNLGWAYTSLEQFTQAREVLEKAVALEGGLETGFESAVPHYYLALTYEALDEPEIALRQWEVCLSYLKASELNQIGWDDTVREHLRKLRGEEQ